ncbi:hypothetical protein [Micromonospora carbonacea]|uniref:hypothetical protein n=1 Tax=Micromonospora carbonacea TaxID=47853 RepID=UPI0037149A5B
MGYKTAKLEVYGYLSNHNSDQDDADQQAWEMFAAEVREMAARPEYADLNLMVNDWT